MEQFKKYIKPKFNIIKINLENLILDGSDQFPDQFPDFDAKAFTSRIIDDSDDWSDDDY